MRTTPNLHFDENTPEEALATEPIASAEEVYKELREGELKEFSVGLVHGQMDKDAKALAMETFRDGETQVLVATTVVEVGVDVPNATLMVIHQAERFGLSQLHQLRGRIGRGKFQGYCFLFTETANDDSQKRLAAMEQTSDGFKIAEVDFELRGPGDILGTRQHGDLPVKSRRHQTRRPLALRSPKRGVRHHQQRPIRPAGIPPYKTPRADAVRQCPRPAANRISHAAT